MVRKHLGYLVVRFCCIINHNSTILAVVAMSKMEADWAKSGNTLYAHTLCAYSVSLNIFYSHCICSFSNCSLCPAPHHQQQKKVKSYLRLVETLLLAQTSQQPTNQLARQTFGYRDSGYIEP